LLLWILPINHIATLDFNVKFIFLDFLSKLTFCLVGKKFVLTKLVQNTLKVFYMLFYYLGVHQDIINVNGYKLVQLLMEDKVHEGHDHQWSVAQSKWHH